MWSKPVPESKEGVSQAGSFVPRALWVAAAYSVALLWVFRETTWSLISIWSRSDTFAHGFLILPISIWVAWSEREKLRSLVPAPVLPVSVLMVPVGALWLLAALVDVLVVQQVALVSLLVLGVWTIVGHQVGRAIAFPLMFLFFAVPMGEGLIAPMMEFTATSTVWLIQQTGIPVYREGLFFTLPSGRWSVVEACSGVRYIIASVTLGVIYAYLTYHTLWKRLVFVLVSAIVPVFANTARAYIIVMLGHLSDMSIATGADHLLYGWVFFGLVIFLLFWMGSLFREDQPEAVPDSALIAPIRDADKKGIAAFVIAGTVALAIAFLGPATLLLKQQSSAADNELSIVLPAPVGKWKLHSEPQWKWLPHNSSASQAHQYFESEGQVLGLFIQYSQGSDTDGEVVGSSTRFIGADDDFLIRSRGKKTIPIAGSELDVDYAQITGPGGPMLSWSWYRIGATLSSNDYLAKLLEAKASLGLGEAGSFRIVIAVPLSGTVAEAEAILSRFVVDHGVSLNQSLSASVEAT